MMKTIEKMSTTTKVLLAGAVVGGVYLLTRKPKKPVAEEQPEVPPEDGLGTTGPSGERLYEFNVIRSITPQGTFFVAIVYQPGVVPRRSIVRIRTISGTEFRFTTRRLAVEAARNYIQTVLEGSAVCIGGCPGLPKNEILPPLDLPVP